MNKRQRVLLGMSGGVDSAVSALLLMEQGYEVVGATLRLQSDWAEAAGSAPRDLEDARAVADRLGMRHLVLDWRDHFREQVLDHFAGEYDRGRTPNPCVRCNRTVKFPALFQAADREGIELVATGHYARILTVGGRERLARATNHRKDQSYALYGLCPKWLGRLRFPLGDYGKEEVRRIAREAGLPVSRKTDSQDICFVPDGDYASFLARHTGHAGKGGVFVDREGRVLGPHRGIRHYTVGQRKGLGISLGAPAFVQRIDPVSGKITLAANEALYTNQLEGEEARWLDGTPPEGPVELLAKIRYAAEPGPARVTPLPGDGVRVEFRESQRAATPGQSVVFYDGDFVVGGAVIRSAGNEDK